MRIDLGSICLDTFLTTSSEHLEVFRSFKEESHSQFIHSIDDRLLQNKGSKSFPFDTGFVVTLKSGECIGYLFISSVHQDEVFLESSILKEKRHLGYGKMCLNLVTDYLFEHYNLKDIALDIDVSNDASMKTAEACGYYADEYLNNRKIIYRNYNLNYINKRRKGK